MTDKNNMMRVGQRLAVEIRSPEAVGPGGWKPVWDAEVLEVFLFLTRKEGIIPAFESTHAVAWVVSQAGKFKKDDVIVINLSGRGDKDVDAFIKYRSESIEGGAR